jgi:phosphoribosyl 1,2-cyclic phosphate phosphodiesterase
VVNALRKKEHISHFTLQEAIGLANELKIPTAYFTHISHQLGLHNEIEKELPENMHLVYDGLKLNISGK